MSHERHFLLYVSFGDWIAHLCDFVAFPGVLMVDGPHLSVISVFIFLYLRGGRSGEAGVSYPSISFLYFHTEYANNTNILCLLFCTDIATNIHSLPGAGRNMNIPFAINW